MSKRKYQCKNIVDNSSTESRHALIEWINNTTDLNLKKIEQLCSGVAYCKLMDMLFPGCIYLKRIKVEAKFEYDFTANFKIFQTALESVQCNKEVPISRLVKGKFQENLEFLQWFKKFFDLNYITSGEDTSCSRAQSMTNLGSLGKSADIRPVQVVRPLGFQSPMKRTPIRRSPISRQASLKMELDEMIEKRDILTQQRMLYFQKLRHIEILCNENQDDDSEEAVPESVKDLVSKILNKLYEYPDFE